MKVSMNTCVKKYADLEKGADEKSLHIYVQKPTKCSALLNGAKVVLCLELVILVGWFSFMAVDSYVERRQYQSRIESYNSINPLGQIDDTSDLETPTAAVTESTTLSTDEFVEDDIFLVKPMPFLDFGELAQIVESSTASQTIAETIDEDQKYPENDDQSELIGNIQSPVNSDFSNYDDSEKDEDSEDLMDPLATIKFPMQDKEKGSGSSVNECGNDEIFTSLQADGQYGLFNRCISRELYSEYFKYAGPPPFYGTRRRSPFFWPPKGPYGKRRRIQI